MSLPTMRCAGAEVVRLYEQVLGKEGFRKGIDLYFQRHDGQVRQYSRARPAPHLDSTFPWLKEMVKMRPTWHLCMLSGFFV